MGVVLLILRILLDILILVIGLVLLLLLIVLFVPVHYRVSGVLNEEEKSADFKVRWLIASAKGNYNKEEGLKFKAKVLFFTLLDSEKKEDPKKTKNKKSKKKTIDDLDNVETDEIAVSKEEIKALDDIGEPGNAGTTSEFFEPVEKLTDLTKNSFEIISDQASSLDSASDTEKDTEKKSKIDKVYEHLDRGSDKVSDVLDKTGEKLRAIEKKADHVEQFLYKDYTQQTIKRGKTFLGKTLKAIKPRKGHGFIRFGLSNAADTGIWLGRIAMFYPFYGKWLLIEPDFYNKVFNMDLDLKGQVMLGPTAIRFLILYLRKDTKKTINLAKKI